MLCSSSHIYIYTKQENKTSDLSKYKVLLYMSFRSFAYCGPFINEFSLVHLSRFLHIIKAYLRSIDLHLRG